MFAQVVQAEKSNEIQLLVMQSIENCLRNARWFILAKKYL